MNSKPSITNKEELIKNLAKEAIENYIKKGIVVSPSDNLPEEVFKKRAGAFVTIKKRKNLRGCIGTYLPTKENIAQEIIYNAISAATKDYRLGPVKEEELPLLSYEIYILDKPQRIKSIEDLDPLNYGIIVKEKDSFKTGLLLPGLEGINNPQQQISIVCKKAGISLANQSKVSIHRFRAKKYVSSK